MATTANTSKALAETPKPKSLTTMINESVKELGRALPAHMNAERIARIALTNMRLNPALAECTPESFLGALFTAAQIGIEPVGGRAYLIPFNNSRKIGTSWKTFKEVQFVMGYKGLAELFYRHEKAVQFNWGVVKANDFFEYEQGTDARLTHRPAMKDRGETIGFYAIAELKSGGKPFLFMSLEDCLAHGKEHSKTFDNANSPWKTSRDAMCLKTVMIQLMKVLPLSIEVRVAIQNDETTRSYRKGVGSMLDIPDHTEWNKAENAEVVPEKPKEAAGDAQEDLEGIPPFGE